jgi:hypothetical protein
LNSNWHLIDRNCPVTFDHRPVWPVTSNYWVFIGQLLWTDKLSHPPQGYLALLSFWLYYVCLIAGIWEWHVPFLIMSNLRLTPSDLFAFHRGHIVQTVDRYFIERQILLPGKCKQNTSVQYVYNVWPAVNDVTLFWSRSVPESIRLVVLYFMLRSSKVIY